LAKVCTVPLLLVRYVLIRPVSAGDVGLRWVIADWRAYQEADASSAHPMAQLRQESSVERQRQRRRSSRGSAPDERYVGRTAGRPTPPRHAPSYRHTREILAVTPRRPLMVRTRSRSSPALRRHHCVRW